MTHLGEGRGSHAIVIAALVIGTIVGIAICHLLGSGIMNASMHSAMSDMTAGLENKDGMDFEKAFVDEMIVHHEGAVAMAQMVLQKSPRPELIKLANDIISAQTQEITTMRQWRVQWFGATLSVNSTDGAEHGSAVHDVE